MFWVQIFIKKVSRLKFKTELWTTQSIAHRLNKTRHVLRGGFCTKKSQVISNDLRRDFGVLVGMREDFGEQGKTIVFYEMSLAYKNLIKQRVLRADHASCSVEEFYLAEFQKYLISLSQIEILGEAKYYEY